MTPFQLQLTGRKKTKGNWQLLDRIVQNFKMHCFGNWIWCVVFQRFVLFRRCLDAEIKDGVRVGLHIKCKKEEKEFVSEQKEATFWEKKLLGTTSAKSLLNTIYFHVVNNFSKYESK